MISWNTRNVRLPFLIFLIFSTLACTLLADSSGLNDRNAATVFPTRTAISLSASPVASPSPLPPSPTPPAIATEISPTPEVEFSDLSAFRQAMLPEFADDVNQVAAGGASRYDLQVMVEFPDTVTTDPLNEPVQLTGTEQVRYTNTEDVPLSEIYFRLYPNLPGYGGRMTVGEVMIDGQKVIPELEAENSAMRVPLPHPLAPEAVANIILTFQVEVPLNGAGYNIFSYTDGTLTLAGFYPAIAVYDDEGWNIEVPPPYGDATFLDTSLYQVELTVPETMVIAASGSVLAEQATDDGSKTLSLASGPMRDFYLAMRPDFEAVSELVDGILVTSYYPPALESGGIMALQIATDSLRVFNERFGPYPYAEFDVVATPTNAGGVEYPGIVVVSQFLYGQPGLFFQHATAHEVAHQWWYSLVGNDQIDEPWLDESLTNYSTVFYWEAVEGQESAERIVRDLFMAPYERAESQGQDRAVAGPVSAFSEGEYGTFVYGKGPLFFHELRRQVGDDLFFEIMQSYYAQHKYGIAYPEDLLTVIEQISGQNIEPLFETWIAGTD